MDTFCAANGTHQKFRNKNFYHNVPCARTLRPMGSDYTMSGCNRRQTPSVHALWQERMSPRPYVERNTKSKEKLCSVALAIASFLVLVAVLAIAGLALYMGALHSEPSSASNLLTFSVSAKVLRGDRFVGALQEKARRYRVQLETLYQRSVLGPGLVSCVVERFGNDTYTVLFRLTFNKLKLSRKINNIEKTIRDILITDAISRKPVFRSIRFDPKNIDIKQIISDQQTVDSNYQRSIVNPKESSLKSSSSNVKNGVVVKTQYRSNNNNNSSLTTNLPSIKSKTPVINDEIDIKEDELPVIQGSFKISKTDADITEKKTEHFLTKSTKQNDKISNVTTTTRKPATTTTKETYVTSALYKIAAIEKINKTQTSLQSALTTSVAIPVTTAAATITPIKSTTSSSSSQENPLFVVNPHLFNEEPWIPIMPHSTQDESTTTKNLITTSSSTTVIKTTQIAEKTSTTLPSSASTTTSTTTETTTIRAQKHQPIYTSFTNPGLSYHAFDGETLGSTSLKSHPIPVNKIPQMTEPSIFSSSDILSQEPQPTSQQEGGSFVEVETVKYIPGSSSGVDFDKTKQQDQLLKNISSIFHNLASTLQIPEANAKSPNNNNEKQSDVILGQGQVEVVEADEETLMMQTTKVPLVTLIPVKSNVGIGRPLRKRPYRENETDSNVDGNLSVENRSFPGSTRFNDFADSNKNNKFVETEVVTSISSEVKRVKMDKSKMNNNNNDNFQIVGILNFATESNLDRNPKMDVDNPNNTKTVEKQDVAIFATNSSITSNQNKTLNILTPDKLKQLSEISKLNDNLTSSLEPVISTKAISSSYTVNHSGFKILTKTFNKINDLPKDNKANAYKNIAFTTISNKTECGNFTIKCGDGQCLPETTKCNQLIDCNDGKDEQDCNCADYLRSQFLLRKICDGVVDCWDYSDENQCEWCKPNQYVCGNSKVCIDKTKICDGIRDCPQGDDERQCVTIASTIKAADEFPYYSEGYLMVRKYGNWGKLCVENFKNVVAKSHIAWEINDLGKAVCKSMTYQSLDSIKSLVETDTDPILSQYFELAYSFQNKSKSSLSFTETECNSKKIVKVKCESLECGARPQAVKHIARRGYRIVGGGNAGLGAWPWQAALYKEGEFQCGATLLSDTWLISAGHCFYHSQEEHWVARLGALRRGTNLPSPYEQLRTIVKIIVHPGYVDSGFINDISLLKMESAVVFSDYVRPICLPQPGQVAADGRLCTVVGWGQLFEVGRIFPDTLQEVQVPVISTAECRKRTVFLPLYKITDDMFCAGYERGGRDACLGDSGGPLMCPESNGRWILQGITSNGYGCARANRPGVYTKVVNYITWIGTHMNKIHYDDDNNSTKVISKSVCLGHRCPLGECLPKSRLCNGYIECSDGSDERDC